ncbi:hypothetical protein AB0N05_35365 [Nocardia sp. NPDC051030]|uniref:hypothetical protein n=1 Tax=Nocardia sp. NPDC051030 TaxID=3155162 RepID=UPI00342A2623
MDPLTRRAAMASLRAVPDLLGDLDITLSRSAVGAKTAGARSPINGHDRVLPFHQGASTARAALVDILARIASEVSAEIGRSAPSGPERQATYLFERLSELPDTSTAVAGVGDITRAVRAARAVIDRPAELRLVGRCPCGAALYTADVQEYLDCDACGRKVLASRVREITLGRAADKLASAARIARLLPEVANRRLTADLIRKWAARGRLEVHYVGNQPMFRIGDVLAIASEAHTR